MTSPSTSRSVALSPEEQRDSPDPEQTPSSKSRRVTITAACNACRRRKVRCDGQRPLCSACINSGRECEYDTALAETHGQARKRRHAELQSRNDAYRDIVMALKGGNVDTAQGILRQIRSGADVEALLVNISSEEHQTFGAAESKTAPPTSYEFPFEPRMPAAFQNSKNPYLSSILYEQVYLATPRSRQTKAKSGSSELPQMWQSPYHAANMVDPRFDRIRASPWTTVTSDDSLLRQLLQLYFAFEYPWRPCFHKDLFLEDMKAERSRFCSPLLVNAVMAAACHCHRALPDRADFWRPRTLGYQFLAEAKRLWELERDDGKLTTAQAGLVISATSNADGVDKVGWSYMTQAVAIAKQLQLFSRDVISTNRRTRLARAFTAWSIFCYQSVVSYQLYRPPLLSAPPEEPLPSREHAALHFPDVWLKYPLADNPVPSHFGVCFRAIAEFRVIMNVIAKSAFPVTTGGEMSRGFRLEETLRYYMQLNEWFDHLPDQLSAKQIILPCHFKLHMQYWFLLISLFEPLARVDLSRARTSLGNLLTYEQPRQIVEQANECLEYLVRLYYLRHGFESPDPSLVHFLNLVGFRALKGYQDEEASSDKSRLALSTLILCAKGLHDQSQHYFLSEAVYRLLRARMNLQSPETVISLDRYAKIEDDDERDHTVRKHIASVWPVGIAGITEETSKRQLEEVFRDASRMELDESSEGSAFEHSSAEGESS